MKHIMKTPDDLDVTGQGHELLSRLFDKNPEARGIFIAQLSSIRMAAVLTIMQEAPLEAWQRLVYELNKDVQNERTDKAVFRLEVAWNFLKFLQEESRISLEGAHSDWAMAEAEKEGIGNTLKQALEAADASAGDGGGLNNGGPSGFNGNPIHRG